LSIVKVDIDSIFAAVQLMSKLLGAPAPSRQDVNEIVFLIVTERHLVELARQAIISEAEAVASLLSHFHSQLFASVPPIRGSDPWKDATILKMIREGLFGSQSSG
jgi:hypothetical protein